jgi:hypothetical protein
VAVLATACWYWGCGRAATAEVIRAIRTWFNTKYLATSAFLVDAVAEKPKRGVLHIVLTKGMQVVRHFCPFQTLIVILTETAQPTQSIQ